MKKIGIDRDYLLDVYQVVIGKYNPTRALPATFLVDSAGRIVFREIGARDDMPQRLEQALRGL